MQNQFLKIKYTYEDVSSQQNTSQIDFNQIKCQSLKYFRGAYFNNLLILYLGKIYIDEDHNQISSDGCFYISKTGLQKLQTLDLSYNLINQTGTNHLATGNYPRLVNLIISNNNISYTGLCNLVKGHFPSLAFVQAKNLSFQPSKQMQNLAFRTQVKMFRLQIQ